MQRTLEIDPRFCGPPDSGNGGYVCGWLAQQIEGPAVVRLLRPPPLNRTLSVFDTAAEVELRDGDAVVARARSEAFELEIPAAPGLEAAREAARHFRGFEDHVFPGCFVCGTERSEGDGLRLFTGPVADRELVAAPWRPDASLGANEVAPEFIWAALDCPGAFSFPQPEGRAVVLGEFAAQIEAPVRVGEDCVVIGWPVAHEGRKHRTGSALFDSTGACAAYALGTWIEIPRG